MITAHAYIVCGFLSAVSRFCPRVVVFAFIRMWHCIRLSPPVFYVLPTHNWQIRIENDEKCSPFQWQSPRAGFVVADSLRYVLAGGLPGTVVYRHTVIFMFSKHKSPESGWGSGHDVWVHLTLMCQLRELKVIRTVPHYLSFNCGRIQPVVVDIGLFKKNLFHWRRKNYVIMISIRWIGARCI